MIAKETLFDMARDTGLAGPEVVEERGSGYLLAYWVYGGTAGNRAFVKIDSGMTHSEAKAEIATLLNAAQTRGNQLAGARPPSVAAPAASANRVR